MRKRVVVVIVIAFGIIVAYLIRSPSVDKEEESAATVPALATASQQSQKPANNPGTSAAPAGTLGVASSASTGERPKDVCTELADRRRAREQAALDAEPKDPAWAYPMEQKLREFTAGRFQAQQIEVTAIDCKTNFCEIKAESLAPEMSEQFNKVMSAATEQPWNDFTGIASSHDADSGKQVLHYARLSRRQANQTAREEPDDMQIAVLRAEEQALTACSEQAYERQERARAAQEAEPRDSSWADPMEQLLRQHITAQLVKHPVGHMEIACRATFCKIKATGNTADSQLAFQKVSQEAAAEPWSDLQNSGYSGGSYGDDWHAEVTLQRRGAGR